MYIILILAIVLGIIALLSTLWSNKSSLQKVVFRSSSADHWELKKIATELPGIIHYKKREQKYYYNREIESIRRTYKRFYDDFRPEYEDTIIPANSLLNNKYYVKGKLKNLLDIKRSKYRLPTIHEDNMSVIRWLARQMLIYCGCQINRDKIITMLTYYQKVKPLRFKELYLFLDMLRLELLSSLAVISDFSLDTMMEYEDAIAFKDSIMELPAFSPEREKRINQKLKVASDAFIARLYIELLDASGEGEELLQYLFKNGRERGIDVQNIAASQQKAMAGKAVLAESVIESLRNIDRINMEKILEKISPVEQLLLSDPTGVYDRMDKSSKGIYRRAIEGISYSLQVSEYDITDTAYQLAIENTDHIGYYLLKDDGIESLAAQYKNKTYSKSQRKARLYTLSITLITLSLSILLILLGFFGDKPWWMLVSGILLIPLFFQIATQWVNKVVQRFVRSDNVPAIDLKNGVPTQASTLVAVPALVTSEEQLREILHKLKLNFLSNGEDNIFFSLLMDVKPSMVEQTQQDKFLTELARRILDDYNNEVGRKAFFLFVRKKHYDEKKDKYAPWERKRGAVLQLNELIMEKRSEHFYTEHLPSELHGIQYVITLDEDTTIPTGEAKKMIGAMHHPLNYPIIEEGRVVSGYTLLQPHVRVRIEDAYKNMFSRIYSGMKGYDRYNSNTATLTMGLFDHAIFFGKGIYNPYAFNNVLKKAFPDGQILSHDLIEGGFARVGSVSASLIEGFPTNIFSYFKRLDRWLRGDWQIIGWLRQIVRNQTNQRVVNPLGFSTKFIMFSNLLTSLAPSFTVIAAFLAAVSGNFPLFLLYILGYIAVKFIYHFIKGILAGHFGEQFLNLLREEILAISLLPYSAYVTGRAIVTAVYRMLFNREKLLQWSTAAMSQGGGTHTPQTYFARLWPNVMFSLLLLLGAIISRSHAVLILLSAVYYIFAIFIIYQANQRDYRREERITAEQQSFLHSILDRSYLYFVDFTDKQTGLTCDNYQEYNEVGCAKRTSPTNIGFTMIAHLIALETNMIEEDICFHRILTTLDTVVKMEKWRGQLYNWYDTETAKPLLPMYVSTVDSGNFKLMLMLIDHYIMNLIEYEESSDTICQEIHDKINGLLDEMDFRDLYDNDKQMFYIGYDATNQRYSDSHYDLMMSEARQISYIEVAERNIDVRHWNRLDRPLSCENHKNIMMSWGGSTFEYFMPTLFFESLEHSLMHTALRNYIAVQHAYCHRNDVPFGISESGYNDFDLALNYQYKSFGVPGTGYKRGLKDELVSSAYAAAMILSIEPTVAMEALETFESLDAIGQYGFYEAIDFTKERLHKDYDYAIIKSYMAHHQGMIMTAIFNKLYNEKIQKVFMSIPIIEASRSILAEPEITDCVRKESIFEFNEDTMLTKPLLNHIATYRNYDLGSKYKPVAWLSNGSYAVHINAAGIGQSTYEGFAINRWNNMDRSTNGIFAFLKEDEHIYAFSGDKGDNSTDWREFTIDINRAFFKRKYNTLIMEQEVSISHTENAEIRKYVIHNTSERPRDFTFYLYGEPALCPQESYMSHRTYQNLFLESKLVDDRTMLINRRKKFDEQKTMSLAWRIQSMNRKDSIAFTNDRERAFGRYRDLNDALMFTEVLEMQPNVVEPAMVAAMEITMEPKSSYVIYLTQVAASSEEDCLLTIEKVTGIERIKNSMDTSRARQRARLRFAGLDNKHMRLVNKMLPLILNNELLQSSARHAILNNKLPRNSAWRLGVSGDPPLILVSIEDEENLFRVEHLLKVYMWLIKNGLNCEMVILNQQDDSYKDDMTERLLSLRTKYTIDWEHARDNIKILSKDRITPEEQILLRAIANCTFDTHLPLIAQTTLTLRETYKEEQRYPSARGFTSGTPKLMYYNTYGGFDEANGEYYIRVDNEKYPPMPWCNVITNGVIGSVVSEKGLTYSWYRNARENRITYFDNDPILNECPLVIRVDDESTARNLWSLGLDDNYGAWSVRHGMGYSIYQRTCEFVDMRITVFTPRADKAMLFRIDVTNTGNEKTQIKIGMDANLVIGGMDKRFIVNSPSLSSTIRFAKNNFNVNMFGKIVYLAIPRTSNEDEREYYKYEKNDDFRVNQRYEIVPGQQINVTAMLGICDDEGEGLLLCKKYASQDMIEREFNLMRERWRNEIQTISVHTPNDAINLMMNGRLMYQTMASRLVGRTGFYQCGGALGFRDQLQDVLSLLWFQPDYTKSTILKFAAHQFQSGDVQHWWHPPRNGVRTHIKDDMLFLPYVCTRYIEHTGDEEVLDQIIPYLKDVEIPVGADDWYGTPEVSDTSGTLLEHCIRAIDRCYTLGQHGLPLMEGGDWNDGMNRVGHRGSGESVWLGFFLLEVMQRIYPILMRRGMFEEAEVMINRVTSLKEKLNDTGWDGEWYRRAFYDNGSPMGSRVNKECQIDCISQAWAIISGTADKQRADQSMDSTMKILYDEENKMLRLLWPAFNKSEHDPGYIKGYIAGVRENGGQYTHGALWVVWAMTMMGRGKQAVELMGALNPINHSLDEDDVETYKVEPYVTAADVYSAEGLEGRGGWTWYTGSAGWMYTIILEKILGMKKQGDKLYIDPCIDPDWPRFTIDYRYEDTLYHIEVQNVDHDGKGVRTLAMDGKDLKEGYIPLVNDHNEHRVVATM